MKRYSLLLLLSLVCAVEARVGGAVGVGIGFGAPYPYYTRTYGPITEGGLAYKQWLQENYPQD